MYDPKNIQATSPPHGYHSRGNCIIVQSLYGSGQIPHRVHLTSAVGSIDMLWRRVARYTVGIRSGKPISHFTTPWVHYCASAVWICTPPWQRAPYLTHRLCTHQKDIRSDLCSRCTIPKTHKPLRHPMHGNHSFSNSIIVHPLYR